MYRVRSTLLVVVLCCRRRNGKFIYRYFRNLLAAAGHPPPATRDTSLSSLPRIMFFQEYKTDTVRYEPNSKLERDRRLN